MPDMPLVEIPIRVTIKDNKPCLELRVHISNPETLKQIVSCAFHSKPIILMPIFTNRLRSINSLLEKGIIYRKGNDYFFVV